MMDFNATASLSGRIGYLVDQALEQRQATQQPRAYLGASRLGVACERALQYEFAKAPIDSGRRLEGRMLRIFERGHVMEDCMVAWMRAAGFDLRTRKANGDQFGFAAADGRLQGHIDGVIVGGPDGFTYPALWENKCLGSKSWRDLEKNRLAVSKPVYAAQIALYQAYMGLTDAPALFTAVNKDTAELHHELVAFDAALAQAISDKAVRVLQACDAGEWLPRVAADAGHFECSHCAWQARCWA